MAKDKKSVLIYCDLIHTVEHLPDELAGRLFKHLLEYVNDRDPQTDDVMLKIAFEPIKQQLKRDLQKYNNIVERNRANGAKGGRPKNPNKPTGLSGNPKKPKKPDTDTDTVTDNDKVIDTDNVTEKNNKVGKPPVFSFKKSLLNYGFESKLVDDFLENRKTKKLSNTETAYDDFILEIEKTGREKNEALKKIVVKGWGGFKASWNLDEEKIPSKTKSPHNNIVTDGDYGVL